MNQSFLPKERLHKVDISILHSLRRGNGSRFSELMRPTGLTSDLFKFYLRALQKNGLIAKTASGTYELTTAGKERANNLDEVQRVVLKQPKFSVYFIASRNRKNSDQVEYLVQQRLRQPYYGFWGCLSGPVPWGEDIATAAGHELYKQSGLTGGWLVRSFCRMLDNTNQGELLEDKLFAIVEVINLKGELRTNWDGGKNTWLTLEEFDQQSNRFLHFRDILLSMQNHQPFADFTNFYSKQDY